MSEHKLAEKYLRNFSSFYQIFSGTFWGKFLMNQVLKKNISGEGWQTQFRWHFIIVTTKTSVRECAKFTGICTGSRNFSPVKRFLAPTLIFKSKKRHCPLPNLRCIEKVSTALPPHFLCPVSLPTHSQGTF